MIKVMKNSPSTLVQNRDISPASLRIPQVIHNRICIATESVYGDPGLLRHSLVIEYVEATQDMRTYNSLGHVFELV
jgi:hypothetical protein